MILAIAALVILAVLNRHVGRSLLYPPAAFAAVWAAYLTLLLTAGSRFLPLSAGTLSLFVAGAIAMTIGGAITLYAEHLFASANVPEQGRVPRSISRRLTLLVIALAAAVPIFLRHVMDLIAGIRGNAWTAIRQQMILAYEDQGISQFHLLDNLVYLAAIAAMVCCWEDDGSRRSRVRMFLAVAVAIGYQIATAGRAGAVSLLITLFAIRWLKRGKPSWSAIVVSVVLLSVVFFSLAWFLRKGDIAKNDSLLDSAGALYDGFLLYSVGPMVAFDQATVHPGTVVPTETLSRPLAEIANKFGAHYDVPSIHAAYTTVGPIGNMNVYTMYFSYVPEYGVAGAFLLLIVVGLFATKLFLLACQGRPVPAVLYGFFAASIVLSPYGEYFFLALNFVAKIAVVLLLLYWFPRAHRLHRPATVASPATN